MEQTNISVLKPLIRWCDGFYKGQRISTKISLEFTYQPRKPQKDSSQLHYGSYKKSLPPHLLLLALTKFLTGRWYFIHKVSDSVWHTKHLSPFTVYNMKVHYTSHYNQMLHKWRPNKNAEQVRAAVRMGSVDAARTGRAITEWEGMRQVEGS